VEEHLGRIKRKWGSTKPDYVLAGCEDMDWVALPQDRVQIRFTVWLLSAVNCLILLAYSYSSTLLKYTIFWFVLEEFIARNHLSLSLCDLYIRLKSFSELIQNSPWVRT
jgi:hypothetical protein